MDAVYFGDIEAFFAFLKSRYATEQIQALQAGGRQDIRFSIIYEPSLNVYQGVERVEIIIRNYS